MGDAVSNQSLKVMAGEKRGYSETDQRSELGLKKPKIRDLDPGFCSEERIGAVQQSAATKSLDLNANISGGRNTGGGKILACVKEALEVAPFGRQEIECDVDKKKSKGLNFDLNAEDVSSSINNDPVNPYKNYDLLNSRDDCECASSVGPFEERDPLQLWKEMKQNGFLSSSHGGVPMPKPKGRKVKTYGIKKKIEIAKREQVDRFAKIAAPSGLLTGLNPGIINHVRNSKQVHSIIEALVRSEKHESCHTSSKPGSQMNCGTKEVCDSKFKMGCTHHTREIKLIQAAGSLEAYTNRQTGGYLGSTNKSVSMISDLTAGDGASCMIQPQIIRGITFPSSFSTDFQDVLELKLSSSSTVASENISSLSNEESANITSVTSLSVKAASVASQWLELLHQDVKGRLAALRRSKKRVHEVIHTELPYLLSREFPSNQKTNSFMIESSVGHYNNVTAEAHCTRWGALFHQMDKSLSEEEKQLESWMNQVKEMRTHCDLGLFRYNTANGLPQLDRVEIDCRSEKADNLDSDLAVRAAAASIYSTCNYLSSMENLPCC